MGRKELEKKFEMEDPFNPGNIVKGIIYKDNEHYGDLLIETVNGKYCPQYIYTTPKFTYPGGVSSPRKYNGKKGFPEEYDDFRIYDKLDGSNICLFRYYDINWNFYVSYKTRLSPFLRENSKYADFLSLWKRTSKSYKSQLDILIHSYPSYHFAFELYGSINKVLIEYNVPLDHKLLYAIDRTNGKLIDPINFDYPLCDIMEIEKPMDLDSLWSYFQAMYRVRFIKDKSVEGCMFYINKDGYTTAYKCKPLEVLNEQGDKKAKITNRIIYNTAINALEDIDELDELEESTISLLLEEFSEIEIEEYKEKIIFVVGQVIRDIHFEKEVIEFYNKLGIPFTKENKGNVMREIIKEYPEEYRKHYSTKIYNVLAKTYFIQGED